MSFTTYFIQSFTHLQDSIMNKNPTTTKMQICRPKKQESTNEYKLDFSISGKELRKVISANSAIVPDMGPRQPVVLTEMLPSAWPLWH